MVVDKSRYGIPKSIKIAGVNYDVVLQDFKDISDRTGQIVYDLCTIQIAVMWNNENRSVDAIYGTLIHEIMHGIDSAYLGGVLGAMGEEEMESTIERLGNAFMQVLSDNVLYLDKEDKMPKKVRINGINYKIVFPYNYIESSNMFAHVDTTTMQIKIDRHYENNKRPSAKIKLGLIACIFYIICQDYQINFFFNEDNKYYKEAFVNGLYQVLVDNNIEKIFTRNRR
jgi:hypothetical protein